MVEGGVAGEVGAEDGGAGFDSGPEDHGNYGCCGGVSLVGVWVGVGERGGDCLWRRLWWGSYSRSLLRNSC